MPPSTTSLFTPLAHTLCLEAADGCAGGIAVRKWPRSHTSLPSHHPSHLP